MPPAIPVPRPDRRSPRRRRWPRRTLLSVVVLALGLTITTGATTERFATFGDRPIGAELERMTKSPRYGDGHFHNEDPTTVMKVGMWTATKQWFSGSEMRVPTCALPMVSDADQTLRTLPPSGLRVTWLGHSTTLIEIDGARILTDPMWSKRASPSTLVGPRRFHPPPLALERLPRLDAVVISHDHYDHMDAATLRALAERGSVIHVPLGLGAHLRRWAIPDAQIVEHDWWEPTDLPAGVRLISTPARHFSGRGLFDRDRTLWTSWSLVGPHHRVFFSGDTGLTTGHAKIAEQFGPFDLALLEIGQYHPSWGDIHLGPAGALEAFDSLRAAKLLPIHWSTFELGLHAWSEPAETLTVEAAKRGVAVLTPRLGEPVEPTTDAPTTAWWRALPPTTPRCP